VPGALITSRFAFVPLLAQSQPYRFITGAFLHSPSLPLHIIFNMLVLYQVGPYLEMQFGRLRFVALYLICAFGGSVGYLLLAQPPANPFQPSAWTTPVVGASGAVFGLFGALIIVNHRLGQSIQGILVFIGINAVLGFTIPNVAWQGHLGGLVTGVALGLVLAAPVHKRRTAVQVAGAVAVVAVLVLLSVWKLSTVGV